MCAKERGQGGAGPAGGLWPEAGLVVRKKMPPEDRPACHMALHRLLKNQSWRFKYFSSYKKPPFIKIALHLQKNCKDSAGSFTYQCPVSLSRSSYTTGVRGHSKDTDVSVLPWTKLHTLFQFHLFFH